MEVQISPVPVLFGGGKGMAYMNTAARMKAPRADHQGPQRVVYKRNRLKIIQSQDVCAICGRPVDKTLKYPDPMSATVDHVLPISKGGHPSDIANLQLAHRACNRWKSDKVLTLEVEERVHGSAKKIYQSRDWKNI